jgi:hypothetical protein
MLDTLVEAVSAELADAVAISLALDPRERYESAREMGRALRDGANGISPIALREDRADYPETRATSVMPSAAAPAASAVRPRQPRQGPPRRAPSPQQSRPSAAAPRSSIARRRAMLALLTVLLLVVAIVAVVVVTASPQTKVVLRNVVYSDVQQASQALQELVTKNTK